MELNITIPFIIETQWPVTLGTSPDGFWWRFGIFCGTVSLLPAAKPTPQSLSLVNMDWKVPTVTALV
jgi:hypothetical protein